MLLCISNGRPRTLLWGRVSKPYYKMRVTATRRASRTKPSRDLANLPRLQGRRDRDFLVQRSRFLAALKTRLGLILAKAVAMRSHTSIARRALSLLRYRIANFALQRTFRFTPLGLAFCFFPFSNTHRHAPELRSLAYL